MHIRSHDPRYHAEDTRAPAAIIETPACCAAAIAPALRRAADGAIAPALGEIHEVPAVAMAANEQDDVLVLAHRQEWENA